MKVLGVEDGSFIPRVSRKCLLAGVLMDDLRIENVFIRVITVDGMDVTEKVLDIIKECKDVDIILSGGITFAGFNVLNPFKIYEETNVPVIIISRKRPNNKAVYRALVRHFEDWRIRWSIINRLGEPVPVLNWRDGVTLYIELVGIGLENALEIVDSLTLWGKRPEPLRVASLIAKGLSRIMEVKNASSHIA
ncbi:MAG: hypothetical protein DRJ66_00040 [Thermoprotei archaeon]|nr:MAG: hypothetical protein DRJ66_00040 [Thermoprotei archaeon]RLF20938.1 MAG: hypothetical protein DRZ82_00640 [Thermoprotei archaeon]